MKVALLCLWIAACVGGMTAWGISQAQIDDHVYAGKETFETQQEYTAFKRAISEEWVTINGMEALSSEPPIVVRFEVQVPWNQEFAYGQHTKDDDARWTTTLFIALFFAGLLTLFLAIRTSPNKEPE